MEKRLWYPPVLPSMVQSDAVLLKPDEHCLGDLDGHVGTVVVSSVENGVPAFRQLLVNGEPVPCEGGRRLR